MTGKSANYPMREYSAGFSAEPGPRIYGPVRLASGRVIYRNYRRAIKSAGALSLGGLITQRVVSAQRIMAASLSEGIFSQPRAVDCEFTAIVDLEAGEVLLPVERRRALQEATQ